MKQSVRVRHAENEINSLLEVIRNRFLVFWEGPESERDAIEASRIKWGLVRQITTLARDEVGAHTCALCHLHNTQDEESCEGCPIFGDTDQKYCRGTPYDDAVETLDKAVEQTGEMEDYLRGLWNLP